MAQLGEIGDRDLDTQEVSKVIVDEDLHDDVILELEADFGSAYLEVDIGSKVYVVKDDEVVKP